MLRLFLLALFFSSLPAAAQIVEPTFQRCMKSNDQGSSGITRCYGSYLQRLEKEQQVLATLIRKTLASPSPEGANYEEATINLSKSQTAWSRFVEADCSLGNNVFGLGNAAAAAELDCRIKHYEIRNKQLKALKSDFLSR